MTFLSNLRHRLWVKWKVFWVIRKTRKLNRERMKRPHYTYDCYVTGGFNKVRKQ